MTLTPEQLRAIQSGQAVSVTVDQTECVVVRKDRPKIPQHRLGQPIWRRKT